METSQLPIITPAATDVLAASGFEEIATNIFLDKEGGQIFILSNPALGLLISTKLIS